MIKDQIKPTSRELQQAVNKTVPDVIAKDLQILFCGINPGLYTAAVGHHFARPGNRFWSSLYESGITPRLFSPFEDKKLLKLGIGITNLVSRTTKTAGEITDEEFIKGGRDLVRKVMDLQPEWLVFVGLGAFRTAFFQPAAVIGLQDIRIGSARVWVLPSTSGLNANHTLPVLIELFSEFKKTTGFTYF
jgi:TDG/mug DNA glycosylase family protein